METPLYTQKNVDEAQYILRERAWSSIPPDATLETLKAFSCLTVDQALDETTARGRKADQTTSCGVEGRARCPHLCKSCNNPST